MTKPALLAVVGTTFAAALGWMFARPSKAKAATGGDWTPAAPPQGAPSPPEPDELEPEEPVVVAVEVPADPEPEPELVQPQDAFPDAAADARQRLAADTFRRLWQLWEAGGGFNHQSGTPWGETQSDLRLISSFQTMVGLPSDGFYRSGTGKGALQFGIVPPPPFYWPTRGTRGAKENWRSNMLWQAHLDPERSEEWSAVARV